VAKNCSIGNYVTSSVCFLTSHWNR